MNLDYKEAYLAMYEFLNDFYDRTKSDEVGGLLGEMSLLGDGSTADPAAWEDWLRCIEKIENGQGRDPYLRLK
ncbi:MAG: hypothetical protein ACFB9N_06875 [Geitlerinemataceae cyanobacterium]